MPAFRGFVAPTVLSARVLIVSCGLIVCAGGAEADEPAEKALSEAVGRLGAEQFSEREAAARFLRESGAVAVPALSVAARHDDFEVHSRAMEVLGELLGSEDPATATAVERALEEISEHMGEAARRRALAMLRFHHAGLDDEARDRLESLGAVVTEGYLTDGTHGIHVVLNATWKGSDEDFRNISRLQGVIHVGVHGVPLGPEAFVHLRRVQGLRQVELFGTGARNDAVEEFRRRFPEAKIDVRQGGKLGVAGNPGIGPCRISHVEPGSAADQAGLQENDVVLAIDGQAVRSFQELTDSIGRKGAGDAVELRIERNAQPLVRTVRLGGWQ
jgi:hypothetical protein